MNDGRVAIGAREAFVRRFAICALLFVVGCGPAADRPVRPPAEGGEIVFVSTLLDPAYAYFDGKTKDYAGIDVEIVRAAARRLGLRLTVRQQAFQDLLPSVKSGWADCAGNSLTITPARARDVSFSEPYDHGGSIYLYRTGEPPPTTPRARNLRVGTMMVSTCHFYLSQHNIDPRCYDDYMAALSAFRKGDLDAVFYDDGPIRETVRASNGAFSCTPLENRENYGIAIRKDYPELLAAVNAVIAERRAK